MAAPTPKPGRLLTVKDLAAEFQLSTRSIWRLIDSGQLAAVRIGRNVRITPAARDHFLAESSSCPPMSSRVNVSQ
jgi:excisionase family DNA binding protein